MSDVRVIRLLFVCAALAALALSQNIPSLGDVTTPPPKEPGHALITAPHETVNPANGQVSLRFAVSLPAGRQLDPHFSIVYDSAGAHFLTSLAGTVRVSTQHALYQNNGWSYAVPLLTWDVLTQSPDDASTCDISTDYVVQDANGDRKSFALSITGYASRPAYDDPCDSNYEQFGNANSGDGWTASTPTKSDEYYRSGAGVSVTSPEGTVYGFNANAAPGYGEVPSSITDRNGNSMTLAVNPPTDSALTYTDTLGRTVLSINGFAQPTDSITVSGASSAYTASWTSISGSASEGETGAGQFPCPAMSGGTLGAVPAITSLTGPAGTYTFAYDPSYAVVDRINFPNGGFVTYTWATPPAGPNEAGQFLYRIDPQGDTSPCTGIFSNPVVTDRYLNDGTREVEHQHFAYSTNWGTGNNGATWTSKQTIVTTTDEVASTTWTTTYNHAPRIAPSGPYGFTLQGTQMPVESSVVTANSASTVLSTLTENWTSVFPYLVTDQCTTLDNGVQNWVHNTYSTTGQLTEKDEYDHSSQSGCPLPNPSLLRKTVVTYASFPGLNIVDRPASEVTYAADGASREGVPDKNGNVGPEHATEGCIRTCGPAMEAIKTLAAIDPLQTLQIKNNRKTCKQTVCHTEAQAPSQPTKSSPSSGNSGSGNLLDVAYHPRRKLRGQRVDKVLEHWLSGIDVYATTVPEVVAAFGQPSSFKELTEKQVGNTGPVGSGERIFDWRSHGLKMEVSVGYYTDQKSHSVVESYVQTVDVRGSKPIGKMGVTHAGLKLGDTYADAVRIYGHAEKGPVGFAVNFADGTFLAADTDQFGRINHLHLDTNPD